VKRRALLLASVVLGSLLGALPTHAARTERPLRYMVWDIRALGLEEAVAQLIKQMFMSGLRDVLGDALIENPELLTLGTLADIEHCGITTDCLAQAGGALGIDRIVVGTASALGSAYSLTVKLIDASTGRDARRAQASIDGNRGKILAAMQKLIYELVDPALLHGSLRLDIALAGAEVVLDGRSFGRTPLAGPINGLTMGEHSLKVTSPLITDYFTFVKILPNKTTTVRVDAQQVETLRAQIEAAASAVDTPVYRRWWFWATVAGGLAAVAGSTAIVLSRSGANGVPSASLGTIDFSAP